ncbi:hypothetical protein [Flavobacterium sp. M31R6]|uniref:hypothetical protein n=1 Tax=Flavobacterium sp. M31R6 TaxID=2739062 RepID=UPI00156833CD|nr:hypothetical protein [Flavobacterium sp. M31R6]QKJ63217.1 hypothetical protein HQN62_08750 [Flavobacterium sp. M31R6]
MKSEIVYVEIETGANHDGLAQIGKCFFSKTGLTIYFNGNVYQKGGRGSAGNYYDIETGNGYWISGVKKNGTDRHKFGKGIIEIDESVIDEYLKIIGETELQKNKFKLVQLNNVPAKEKATEILNEKYEAEFDNSIRFKNPSDLTKIELENLIKYYNDFDLPKMYKKNRKEFIEELKNLEIELEKRNVQKNYA